MAALDSNIIYLILVFTFFILFYNKALDYFGFSQRDGNVMFIGYLVFSLFKSISYLLSGAIGIGLIGALIDSALIYYFYKKV